MTTHHSENQFFQFSIKMLLTVIVAAAFFALLMQLYGVDVILPWAFFFGLMSVLFVIGKWLTYSIRDAASKDPSTPKTLERFNSQYEAQVFISKLAENGIEANSVGGYVSGFQAESPGYVDVVVPASIFEEAKQIAEKLNGQNFDGVQVVEG